jgi:hypothetical protein
MGKRLFLNGGENTHLFPVVSKLCTTVETHHICSGERGGLAAALSWLAGLGKADSFMPASEQSVKDLHNLLLAVASSYRSTALPWVLLRIVRPVGPETSVTVSSGLGLDFVSLDFHIPMTQIVINLYCEHCFQYVERRYSGFVALSFVVSAGS